MPTLFSKKKFPSLFQSLVNIHIDVKQKFCSEIRVLHIALGILGARRAVFCQKTSNKAENGASRGKCCFFLVAAGSSDLNFLNLHKKFFDTFDLKKSISNFYIRNFSAPFIA
jgi:hypothetical protein